jgi:hypothetical protein
MSSSRSVMSSSHYSDESDQRSGESTATSSAPSSASKLTPSRSKASIINARFDFAFRITVLGDSGSSKRELVHNLVYGKLSKEATKQDRFLDQISG